MLYLPNAVLLNRACLVKLRTPARAHTKTWSVCTRLKAASACFIRHCQKIVRRSIGTQVFTTKFGGGPWGFYHQNWWRAMRFLPPKLVAGHEVFPTQWRQIQFLLNYSTTKNWLYDFYNYICIIAISIHKWFLQPDLDGGICRETHTHFLKGYFWQKSVPKFRDLLLFSSKWDPCVCLCITTPCIAFIYDYRINPNWRNTFRPGI